MTQGVGFSRFVWAVTVALTLLVAYLQFLAGELTFTGDETRYAYASVAAWSGNNLYLSPDQWVAWLSAYGIRTTIEAGCGIHSIIHSILLSPVVALFGLEMGRWAQSLLICLISIPFLVATDFNRRRDFAVWTTIFFTSLPAMPYLRLLYPGAWMLLLLSMLLFCCSRERLTPAVRALALACIVLMPFIHIRSSLVAAVLGVYFFYRVWSEDGKVSRSLVLMVIAALAAMPLFVWYQIALSGQIAGTASTAALPSPAVAVNLIAMQLFGYRHGLVLYNPLALIGIAGLFLGTLRRIPLLTACAIAFVAYVFTVIWATASESFVGRFWDFIVPLLIYGAVFWFRSVNARLRWIIALPLGLMTLFNAILFVIRPDLFLENRFGALPYEYFQRYVGIIFDPGLIAATDPFEAGKIVLHGNDNTTIFFFLMAFLVCLIGMAAVRWNRSIVFTVAAVSILGFAGYKALMVPIPRELYAVESGVNAQGNAFVTFKMQDREMIRGFKVGNFDDRLLWGVDKDSPKEFSVTGLDPDGGSYPAQIISGYQLAKLQKRQRYSVITITATKPAAAISWTELPIKLF